MCQTADLGHKGHPPAPDLAHRTPAQEHALAGVGPVHAPELDLRIVPAAVKNVGFHDPVGGQDALRVLRIDAQV